MLLAQAPKFTLLDPSLLRATALLAVTLVAGAILIFLADRWRRRMMGGGESSGEEMMSFRALYERGELSKEEYDRVKARLHSKLRKEMKLPEKPAAPPQVPPAPADGPPPGP